MNNSFPWAENFDELVLIYKYRLGWLAKLFMPREMKKDMEILIGNTPAFAVRTSMSAPAAIQTRAYYI